jgi:hypothetical protein
MNKQLKNIYQDALKRTPTQKETILEKLRDAGSNGVLNTDLVQICIRYTSRLQEMYQEGYRIDVDNLGKGVCNYTLISEPLVKAKPQPALDVLINHIDQSKLNCSVTTEQLLDLLDEFGFNIVRKCGSFK